MKLKISLDFSKCKTEEDIENVFEENKEELDKLKKMSIESLKRVMWRLRKRFPDADRVTNNELRKVIEIECGTDPRTYRVNRAVMIRQGWIKSYGKKCIYMTNKDLEEE